MRPLISWADLAGRHVGVWGAGREGLANVRKLRSLGVEPVIVDDRPERVAGESALPTAGAGLDALLGCEAVVKTPGISRHRPEARRLAAAGIPLVGGLGLWLAGVDRSRVVCVTGTKGKSTTTSIIAHIANGLGRRTFAGGNLGVPPYDPAAPADAELWAIETSSYQATDVAVSPPLVVVTSLHPDHLPWHGDVETYYSDKLSLCTQPGARLTVAAASSPALVERRHLLGPEVRWVESRTWGDRRWAEPLQLPGEHNVVNANLARAALVALGVPGADDAAALRVAAHGYERLPSRLTCVRTLDGVDFVDDSLSTNVLPTLAALSAYPGRRVALIAGGLDRHIDYEPLAAGLAERDAESLVLAVYATGPRIRQAVEALGATHVRAQACANLDEAVDAGYRWACPDGVVLLSPAAASFDEFDDYQHRAAVFLSAVERLPL